MTNVFRGAGARLPLPTSSFQDDLVPAGPAKPQQTIMEKLLTQGEVPTFLKTCSKRFVCVFSSISFEPLLQRQRRQREAIPID